MSIEKKSLISTLKSTKKANAASAPVKPEADLKADHVVSKKFVAKKFVAKKFVAKRMISNRNVGKA